jgi:N-methylhydantoinase B
MLANIDPITLEVIRNRLDTISDEMEVTLLRSAHSSVIKEGMDASAALFDADAQLIAQANAAPVHLASLGPAVQRICEVFPPSTMKPGDVFLMNDPYEGAQHIPDIIIVVPVIASGKVVALSGTMAHHQDMGGKAPGSTPQDSTEIFQEGLILPPLKMYEEGRPNETLMSILKKNIRIPDTTLGDMDAQIAAGNTGRRRILELVDEFGLETAVSCMKMLQDRSEAMTRNLIEQIPDGDYVFTDYLDNDGVDLDKRLKIHAKITIRSSDFIVDFEGTNRQVRGPINGVPSVALSAARYVVRAITDPDIPNNEGCYRPISLKLPKGSMVNPRHPAPVKSRSVTLRRMIDTMMGATVQAIPDRVNAANNGHPLMCSIGGYDRKADRRYVTSIIGTGGMGARPTKDGVECVQTDASNAMNIPVEATETYFPLRVTRWALRNDSGGGGKFRGGLGLEYFLEVLDGEVQVSHRGERHYTAPWGLFGGCPGARTEAAILRDGIPTEIPSKQEYTLRAGEKVEFRTTGGGGYGDPLERDIDAVLDDVMNGKVSLSAALEMYGVAIRTGNGVSKVDETATQGLRHEKRAARGPITWTYDRGGELGRE